MSFHWFPVFSPALGFIVLLVCARETLVSIPLLLLGALFLLHRMPGLLGLQFRQVMSDVLASCVYQTAVNIQAQYAGGS